MATTRYSGLLQERADLTAAGEAVFKAAETENRALTAEERAADDAREARLQAIGEEIAIEERRRARQVAAGGSVPVITGGHSRAADMPWGHERGVRIVEGADGVRSFGGVSRAVDVALGSCMQAIFRAGMGGPIDPRLLQAAASGGNTSDPAAGGFSVGTDLSVALMQMGMESSKLLSLCMTIPISGNADSIEAPYLTNTSRATGSRFGGVRVYRRAEADTVASSYPEEEMFELRLLDLMGLAYQTDRLMADAAAMGAIYGAAFRNEFAWVIDNEIIRGTGAGQGQGVLNSGAINSTTKETGQAAATFTNQNVSDMWVRLWDRAGPNTRWFYNREVGPQLDNLSIPAGTAALEPRFVNYGPDGVLRIKGVEAVRLEQCSALGTIGDVLLLDLSQMIVITKGVLEQAESDHVRFIYGERTFRWTQRINNKSHWRSTVAPANGTIAVSPFVALETRA